MAIGQAVPGGGDLARPVRHFVVEFYRRHIAGLASLSLAMAVANFVGFEAPNVPLVDFNDATKCVVDARTVVPVTKEVANFISLELNALITMLKKLATSLAFEQKLEALCACQQVLKS